MSLPSISAPSKTYSFYTYAFQRGPELKAAPGPKFVEMQENVPMWTATIGRNIVYLSSEQLEKLPQSLKTHQLFLDFLKACSLMIHPNDLPQSISPDKKAQHQFDSKQALDQLQKTAEQRGAEAQSDLGSCYLNGRGVEKNEAEAVKWFGKAAEQGYAPAQCNLGGCYGGVEKNVAEAFRWYRKAAEQGYARAQNNLGVCYMNGLGVEKNEAEGVKWIRKAAKQGYALAQNNLGVCYENGRGVEKNEAEAVNWYRKAAEQGLAVAQQALNRLKPNSQPKSVPSPTIQGSLKSPSQALAKTPPAANPKNPPKPPTPILVVNALPSPHVPFVQQIPNNGIHPLLTRIQVLEQQVQNLTNQVQISNQQNQNLAQLVQQLTQQVQNNEAQHQVLPTPLVHLIDVPMEDFPINPDGMQGVEIAASKGDDSEAEEYSIEELSVSPEGMHEEKVSDSNGEDYSHLNSKKRVDRRNESLPKKRRSSKREGANQKKAKSKGAPS